MGYFLVPVMLGVSVWGGRGVQSGTTVKDQGSYVLVSVYGAQRECFMAYVHWDRKGSNPSTILIIKPTRCTNFSNVTFGHSEKFLVMDRGTVPNT